MKNTFESKWEKVNDEYSVHTSYIIDLGNDIFLKKVYSPDSQFISISLYSGDEDCLYDSILNKDKYNSQIRSAITQIMCTLNKNITNLTLAKEKLESIVPKTVKVFKYKNLKFKKSELTPTFWSCPYKDFNIEIYKSIDSNDWICEILLNGIQVVEVQSPGKKSKVLNLALNQLKTIGVAINGLSE